MYVCQSKLCLSVLIVSIFCYHESELNNHFFKKCRACICIHSIEFSVPSQCWWDKTLFVPPSTVKQPPTIMKQSLKDYIVDPRDNIIIECEAKGTPVPTWEWMKPFCLCAISSCSSFLSSLTTFTFPVCQQPPTVYVYFHITSLSLILILFCRCLIKPDIH